MKTNKIRIIAVSLCLFLLAVMMVIPVNAEEKTESLYINAINKSVTTGTGTIFTKDFNKTNTIKSKDANFKWVALFTAKPTSKAGVFEIVETGENLGETKTVTIPEGGFIYSAHMDDVGTTPAAKASQANRAATKAVKKGTKITLVGVDLKANTITNDAKIFLKEVAVDTSATTSESSVVTESSAVSSEVSSEAAVSDTSVDKTSSVASAVSVAASSTTSTESKASDGLTGTQIALIAAGVVILIAAVSFGIVKARKK